MKRKNEKKPIQNKQLAKEVFERMSLPIGKAAVSIILTHFLRVVREKLINEETVVLWGIGKLKVRLKAGYEFNSALSNKKKIYVKPRLEIRFIASPALRKELKRLTIERGYYHDNRR